MNLQRHLQTVVSARWLFSTACLAGAVSGLVLSFAIPAHHKATAAVVVEPQKVDPFSGVALPPPLFSHMPTEVDVLRSERVATRVVTSLGMQKDQAWQATWQKATDGRGSIETWLGQQALRHLDISPSRESNVLTLSYTDQDPARAAQMVNAFVQAYISTSLELRQQPARAYRSYFDQTALRLRKELVEAQARLSQFQREKGVVSVDDRVDVESARLAELSTQVTILQANASAAGGRERQARGRDGLADVQRDPGVSELRAELGTREARLSEMATRLGDSHPSVVELRTAIADLRLRTEAATRRAQGTIGADARVVEAQLAAARAALEAQRSRVLSLNSLRDQARVLQREVDNAQRSYEAVLARSNQASLESGGAGNIMLLSEAEPPTDSRWWSHYAFFTIFGAMAAILAALLYVLWREHRDPLLRTWSDIDYYLEQPILGRLRAPG